MENTIYLRPSGAQPYHIMKAAEWLTRLGKVKNKNDGYKQLVALEIDDISTFKNIMSRYHKATSFKTGYLVYTDDSHAFRSAVGPYGEEPHMY